jgi:hypothetical protein
LNLKLLSQVIRFGSANLETLPSDQESRYFIEQWSQHQEFPAPLLVRILLGVINLLETIHTSEFRDLQGTHAGVIWNDVKPDHLYWNPTAVCLTVIDWGNSQFLERDGATKDRQYSATDDYRQFIQEMGSFISEVNPELFARLEWPDYSTVVDAYQQFICPLKEKITAQYEIDSSQLQELRRHEADLYSFSRPGLEKIDQYQQLRQQLSEHGEMPDSFGATSFMVGAAYQMTAEHRLAELREVCENASNLPSASSDQWNLIGELAEVTGHIPEQDANAKLVFTNALTAGLAGDWPTAIWELFTYLGDGPRPEWWEKISQEIRKVCLGLESDAIAPYTLFARLYYTLQAEVTRKGNQRLRVVSEGIADYDEKPDDFHWQDSEELVIAVRDEIISKWKELEPSPPDSGIDYRAVDGLIDRIEELLPGWRNTLDKSLAGPRAQVDLVLKAWEQKDFELARRGLRYILVWDPDRLRLFTAEKAISIAPEWLARIHQGASKDEPFYDYLTSIELAGRKLRNQVGPARWLDDALEAFKRLRRGSRSVDLMLEFPEIMHELPWLNEYQSREILSLPHLRPLIIERQVVNSPVSISAGVVEGKFGAGQDMVLGEPLDTWVPEARGSSARVFSGILSHQSNQAQPLAFKIMRPDQVDYALPLFIEEIKILTMLRDVPGITPFVECGYIKFQDNQALPSDESHASASGLSGQVIHYGAEQVQNFLASMDRQLALGWLPYLALVKRNSELNLLRYCDASYTHGWFLSLRDSLILSIQICDILQFAHDRNVAYRDHKILHYYWDPEAQGVSMIDWNIAKHQPQGLSEAEKQFDLVQFGARALHHIFTGRPAQGSLSLGPNRPEEIENASLQYPVNWTYDDERLPNQLRTILEQALNQGYTRVCDIRQDLLGIYQQLSGTEKS